MVCREIKKKPTEFFKILNSLVRVFIQIVLQIMLLPILNTGGKCFIYIFNKITRRKQLERIRIRIRIYLCDQNVNLLNSPKHPRVFL